MEVEGQEAGVGTEASAMSSGTPAERRARPRTWRRRAREGEIANDSAVVIDMVDASGFAPAEAAPAVSPLETESVERAATPALSASLVPLAQMCDDLVGAAVAEAERRRAELDKWRAIADAAIAEADRARAELDKWREIAEERSRALARADAALDAVTRAVDSAASMSQAALDSALPLAVTKPSEPALPSRNDATEPATDFVTIPPEVRQQALRYAGTMGTANTPSPRRSRRVER
jgi:hypothetical protein